MSTRAVTSAIALCAATSACAAASSKCEEFVPHPATARPVALESVELFGVWDLQLRHQEPGHEGQVTRYVARLWSPDSAIRAQMWWLAQRQPGLLAIGSASIGNVEPDTVFRWHRDHQREPLVVVDSALILGDPPGGVDGSSDYLTVREATAGGLRGRWTSAYSYIALNVDTRLPLPDPEGYFCATKREGDT
jgi:hypothetical protein